MNTMKSWLKIIRAITLFAVGMIVGRFGLFPHIAIEAQADPSADGKFVQTSGTAGGSFSWQQIDSTLEVMVTGQDVAYLAIADLADGNASGLGSPDGGALYTQEDLVIDLTQLEELVFFRLEPIGGLKDGVFLPCNEVPALCFPTRPPVFPPGGARVEVFLSDESEFVPSDFPPGT